MRATRVILCYAVCVFLCGALLAYPVYLGLTWAGVEEPPFHKVVTRLLKLLALAGLWPLLHFLGLGHRRYWGLRLPRRVFLRETSAGLAAGAAMLLVLAGVLFALGARVLDEPLTVGWSGALLILLKGLVAGLAVAIVEELWFRGALFSVLQELGNTVSAVFVTAGLYALVHFIRADVPVAPRDVVWSSGFEVIVNSFGRLLNPVFLDSALALFAAGLLLALIRRRTGNIALCIGIHAGWVLVIKSAKSVSHVDRESEWFFLVGAYDGVTGVLAAAWLGILAMAYYWSGRTRRDGQERSPAPPVP